MLIKNKNLFFCVFFLFFSIFFFSNYNKVFAATINFSPVTSTYSVGDIIKVKVVVSSDKSINAVSGKVSFPTDLLSLTSLSKSSSIVSLWAQEPSFSNRSGVVSFEGVILNGYIGNSGNILTLVFKAKSTGRASLIFSGVSILANDGNGTDIFSGSLFPGNINLEKAIKTTSITERELNTIADCKNANVEKQESALSCIAINATEKIKEVEILNDLPSNSLLVAIIILIIILLSLIIIYLFIIIFRLKRYLKNKLLKTENAILKNFNNLEKNIESKMTDSKDIKNEKIIKEGDNVLKEVTEVEKKIIKEVEKIEDNL
jgi:hypothetical protein